MKKVNFELLKVITDSTNVPVIASGGVGTLDHLYDGLVKGGASAVLAASIFHYGEFISSKSSSEARLLTTCSTENWS